MSKKFFNTTLASIEEEIRVLKAQVAKPSKGKVKKFRDLEGIWKGKVDFSFKEVQKAKIKLKEIP